MAETKKTAVVKPVAKPVAKAAAVKAEDTKSEETKTETVAAVKEAPKEEEKKPAAKKEKTAAKKSTTKKTAEKKTTEKKTTKAPAKQAKDTAVVHVQFAGKTYTTEDLLKSAKDVWQYDLNRKPEDFKTIELYVKPEESLAYYVINGDVSGSFYI